MISTQVLGLFAVMKRTCGVRSDFGGRSSDSELDSSKHGDAILPNSVKMPSSAELRAAAGSDDSILDGLAPAGGISESKS